MGLEDELRTNKRSASTPTAFVVLQQASAERADWLRAQPEATDERGWYRRGSEAVKTQQISDPLPSDVPAQFRFWWARGLMDAKARGLDLEWLPQKPAATPPPPPDESTLGAGAVIGGIAGAFGIGLLMWRGMRRRAAS